MQSDELHQINEINFKFNVPLVPHHNGLVERIVGSAKRALLHVIKPEVPVTDEELLMAFAMVEAALNACLLTYVGSDFKDLEPLTPEHFLGTSNTLALGLSDLSSSTPSFSRHIRCSEKSCSTSFCVLKESTFQVCSRVLSGKNKPKFDSWIRHYCI